MALSELTVMALVRASEQLIQQQELATRKRAREKEGPPIPAREELFDKLHDDSPQKYVRMDVEAHLTCGICKSVLDDPVQCDEEQQHYFCRRCLDQHMVTNAKSTCPTCRISLPKQMRAAPRVVRDMLSRLPLACVYRPKCPMGAIPKEEYKKHLDNCAYAPSTCTNAAWGCSWIGLKGEREVHIDECLFIQAAKFEAKMQPALDALATRLSSLSNTMDSLRKRIAPASQQSLDGCSMISYKRQFRGSTPERAHEFTWNGCQFEMFIEFLPANLKAIVPFAPIMRLKRVIGPTRVPLAVRIRMGFSPNGSNEKPETWKDTDALFQAPSSVGNITRCTHVQTGQKAETKSSGAPSRIIPVTCNCYRQLVSGITANILPAQMTSDTCVCAIPDIDHEEILARFKEFDSTYEWLQAVTFYVQLYAFCSPQ